MSFLLRKIKIESISSIITVNSGLTTYYLCEGGIIA